MTDWLLGGLCLGQIVIVLILLVVCGRTGDIYKRLNDICLATQELCDRIWKRMK